MHWTFMVKFLDNLFEAEKILHTLSQLMDSNFPIIQDKQFLLKILEETNFVIIKCVEAILYYEHLKGKIVLSSDKKINLKIFMDKCALKYDINSNEKMKILQLFDLNEKHKQSVCEFKRNGGVVILSKDSVPCFFDIIKAKDFLDLGKSILIRILEKIKGNFEFEINIKRIRY